jgi:ATP-dependent Lon protease
MIVPLFVGREKSVRALEEVMREDKQILLASQKDAGRTIPAPDDIYRVGASPTSCSCSSCPTAP